MVNELSEFWHRHRAGCVTVCGDFMLDEYLHGRIERISPEAPVPVVEVEREEVIAGGAGNVARNFRALGWETLCFGVLGDDVAGEQVKNLLCDAGASVEGLVCTSAVNTTCKTRILAGGQHVMRVDRDLAGHIPQIVRRELLDGALTALERSQALVLPDYSKGLLDFETVMTLTTDAHRCNLVITADPRPQTTPLFAGATMVAPNRQEARLATGIATDDLDGLRAAAMMLVRRLHLRMAIITLAAEGMYVLDADGGEHEIPALAAQIVDVTGAGDTVQATATAALACGADPLQAAALAAVAAGLVVGTPGCAVVTSEELYEGIGAADFSGIVSRKVVI